MIDVLNRILSSIPCPSMPITASWCWSSIRGSKCHLAKVMLMKFLEELESIRVFTGSMIPLKFAYHIDVLLEDFTWYTCFFKGLGTGTDMDSVCRFSFPTPWMIPPPQLLLLH